MSYAHWTSPDDASPHGVELTPSAHAGSSAKAAVTTGGGTALVVPRPRIVRRSLPSTGTTTLG